ncbi:MAG TPA: hypothetical protein VM121_05025 [Acidimicrobiales bacterium]|nr:hypothetical protein [Acidimicrobiales bacterium]
MTDREPATTEDYNEMGKRVTEEELIFVEAAALSWSPPDDAFGASEARQGDADKDDQ